MHTYYAVVLGEHSVRHRPTSADTSSQVDITRCPLALGRGTPLLDEQQLSLGSSDDVELNLLSQGTLDSCTRSLPAATQP